MVGLLKAICLSNESEQRSAVFTSLCTEKGIEIKVIQPGKSHQNAYIECFNHIYRHVVSMSIFLHRSSKVEKLPRNVSKGNDKDAPHATSGKVSLMHYRQQAEKST